MFHNPVMYPWTLLTRIQPLCNYVIKDNKSINLHHQHLNNKPASSIIT